MMLDFLFRRFLTLLEPDDEDTTPDLPPGLPPIGRPREAADPPRWPPSLVWKLTGHLHNETIWPLLRPAEIDSQVL